MPRSLASSSVRLTPAARKLADEARALRQSGTRLEDIFWERRLHDRLHRLLKTHNQASLDKAIEFLSQVDVEAGDMLVEAAENAAESLVLQHDEQRWHIQLIACPILVQTLYRIPAGRIFPTEMDRLHAALTKTILSAEAAAHCFIAPYLFSIDQMPQQHADVLSMTYKLGRAALGTHPFKLDTKSFEDTAPILADPRFILLAVAVPEGAPLFQWQSTDPDMNPISRETALEMWQDVTSSVLTHILPACSSKALLPDGFFTACREADQHIRPLTVRAAINYLSHTLHVLPEALSATVARFGAERSEEIRIGLSRGTEKDILYGVIWPLFETLGLNDEETETTAQHILENITEELKGYGIKTVHSHPRRFEPEACEDCGTPFFANRSGDVVHPEMPEDAEEQPPVLH
jgi:hypothetical protein